MGWERTLHQFVWPACRAQPKYPSDWDVWIAFTLIYTRFLFRLITLTSTFIYCPEQTKPEHQKAHSMHLLITWVWKKNKIYVLPGLPSRPPRLSRNNWNNNDMTMGYKPRPSGFIPSWTTYYLIGMWKLTFWPYHFERPQYIIHVKPGIYFLCNPWGNQFGRIVHWLVMTYVLFIKNMKLEMFGESFRF